MRRLLLLAASLAATGTASAAVPTEVTIDTGTLAGTTGASPEIRVFKGILFATHVAEIPYMFDNLAPPVPWTETDRRLADVMASYGVNFARTGNPNGAGLPTWPADGDAATGRAQILGDTVATEETTVPAAATLAFFDAAYQQLLKGGANQ
jgi:carboxylesterase type B